jgi:glycolate oxidase FAD binding subunit
MSATAVASPVAELRDRVREAADRGEKVRVVGRGTWLDAGRPVSATSTLSTREVTGITEYVPGDLTMTVRAGTTLAEIRDATAAHNQWLALDPHGADDGTIGATAATASSGPLSTSFGTPRDLVLGVEFVTGAGAVARGGGRVVKNVAGFDLTRLLVGSCGTLGVITELTVRLHARPPAEVSLAVRLGDDGAARVRTLLRRLPFAPYACEVLNAPLAQRLLSSDAMTVLMRVAGNAEAIRAQRDSLAELGKPEEIDPRIWTDLRACEPAGCSTVRLSGLPSEVEQTWREASALDGALLHATPARGIVRAIFSGGIARGRSTIIAERLPNALWSSVSAPEDGGLSQRVKARFDPSNVLNPGILGGVA